MFHLLHDPQRNEVGAFPGHLQRADRRGHGALVELLLKELSEDIQEENGTVKCCSL